MRGWSWTLSDSKGKSPALSLSVPSPIKVFGVDKVICSRLQSMLNHEDFQREDLGAFDSLHLTPDDPTSVPPLMKSVILQKHQVVAVQWQLQMEASLARGGLLADVRPCLP
jgi:hypothetical protein